MSEPIPESIPTSSDRRSHRPTKKRALTPSSAQSAQVDALFANPDRDIVLPTGPKPKALLAPPEIVANVQGSSAGAGSGEFHVYKASRRREYERLRLMDEEVEKERKDREFEERREKMRLQDEQKLTKNQNRRAKMKARQEKAQMMRKAEKSGSMDAIGDTMNDQTAQKDETVKKKLGPAKISRPSDGGADGTAEHDREANGDETATERAGLTIHDDD